MHTGAGERLRELRSKAGIPRRVLAKEIGVPVSTLLRIEHGRTAGSMRTFLAVAKALAPRLNMAEKEVVAYLMGLD